MITGLGIWIGAITLFDSGPDDQLKEPTCASAAPGHEPREITGRECVEIERYGLPEGVPVPSELATRRHD